MSSPTTKRMIVLIVEDETLIRMDAVEIIVAAGYEVLEAANADQAIEIFGSIDGLKLAHAVRHRCPPVKIVTCSGHIKVIQEDLPEGARFVPKPYSKSEIAATFRELLAA